MMKQLTLIALSLLMWLPHHVKATQFKYNNDIKCYCSDLDKQCEDPVVANITSISCDGAETCHLGDELTAYGSMTLKEDLPSSTMCMTVQSCFLGLKFLCTTHREKVDVCEILGMSADNGATACPSAGSFYFEYHMTVPTNDNWDWTVVGSGWWVTVYTQFTDCNEYSGYGFKCKASFRALSETQASSQSENMYAMGAILIVVGVGYFVFRKRRTGIIDLEQEESNDNFRMMNDGYRA